MDSSTEITTNNASDPAECKPYDNLEAFGRFYGCIHIYVALIICTFGSFANMMNVAVLNYKSMRSSTNLLLTALAVSDGLLMILYVPFDIYFLLGQRLAKNVQAWAWYLFVYIIVQNFLHAFSSWITVTLAVFRVIYIRRRAHAKRLCSMTRARMAVLCVACCSVIITIPYVMAHRVTRLPPLPDVDRSMIRVCVNDSGRLDTASQCPPAPTTNVEGSVFYTVDFAKADSVELRLNFYVLALCVKLAPLLLLTMMSFVLVAQLRRAARRRRKLRGGAPPTTQQSASADRRSVRSTRLLLAIVVIFVVAFLPQAVLMLLSDHMGPCFIPSIYTPLGDFMDLLTLLNNGLNFVLYCTMSKQFRDTFRKLFCRRLINGHPPISIRFDATTCEPENVVLLSAQCPRHGKHYFK